MSLQEKSSRMEDAGVVASAQETVPAAVLSEPPKTVENSDSTGASTTVTVESSTTSGVPTKAAVDADAATFVVASNVEAYNAAVETVNKAAVAVAAAEVVPNAEAPVGAVQGAPRETSTGVEEQSAETSATAGTSGPDLSSPPTPFEKEGKRSKVKKPVANARDGKAVKAKSGTGSSTESKPRVRQPKKDRVATGAPDIKQIDVLTTNSNRSKVDLEKDVANLQTQLSTLRKKYSAIQQDCNKLKHAVNMIAKEAEKPSLDAQKIISLCRNAASKSPQDDNAEGTGKAPTRGRRSNTKNSKNLGRNQAHKKRQSRVAKTGAGAGGTVEPSSEQLQIGAHVSAADGAQRSVAKVPDNGSRTRQKNDRRQNRVWKQLQQQFVNGTDQQRAAQSARPPSGITTVGAMGAMGAMGRAHLEVQGVWVQNAAARQDWQGKASYGLMHVPDVNPSYRMGPGDANMRDNHVYFNRSSAVPNAQHWLTHHQRPPSCSATVVEKLPVAESPAKSSDHPVPTKIRETLRSVETVEELKRIIALAESHGLTHEAKAGRRKLALVQAKAANSNGVS